MTVDRLGHQDETQADVEASTVGETTGHIERTAPRGRRRALGQWALMLAIISLLSTGWRMTKYTDSSPLGSDVHLSVADEDGTAIAGASIEAGLQTSTTDDSGRATIRIERPTVIVVTKAGFLDEPVAVSPDDGDLVIRLFARHLDGRTRTSLHFGGDVMLGRRYLEPDRSTPHVDDEASARRVVTEVGPMARAADTTIVNLESVVGELGDEQALTAKRFLIQSPPLVTAALDELGVDLVTLGNNHAYDWGDAGLMETISTLENAGIGHVGAADTEAQAQRGVLIDEGPVKVGVVSATTVSGDYVNEHLPGRSDPRPDDIAPEEEWQYEERLMGLRRATQDDHALADIIVPLRDMRVGEAWEVVKSAEQHLQHDDAASVWELVYLAYPELQDWVARRGHGGAARYHADVVASEIERLRSGGAQFVVVQLHGGYQFAPVASDFIRTASRRAIDAGADAVVSHHPHVLQGVEWHGDGLIVHSLGNLVFDQDFLSTFPSTLLRVVTDGEQILEARLLPLVLDRYRPTPLAGDGARSVVHTVAARTALDASSGRFGMRVATVVADTTTNAKNDATASVRFERNSGLIERPVDDERTISVLLGPDGTARLPECSLVRADLLRAETEVAHDLFGWGSFDRATTDSHRTFPVGWRVPSSHNGWSITPGRSDRENDLALEVRSTPSNDTNVRVAALIDVPEHRLHDPTGDPIDRAASYELRLQIRRQRGESPSIQLVTYHRNDTDPTVDPTTIEADRIDLPLAVPNDNRWHEVSVPVPENFIQHENGLATALNLVISVPSAHLGTVVLDDVEVFEWRGPVATDRPVLVPASVVRGNPGETVELVARQC